MVAGPGPTTVCDSIDSIDSIDSANDGVSSVEMMDGTIRVEYSGKIVSADEIAFTRQVGDFATEELVARRVKE